MTKKKYYDLKNEDDLNDEEDLNQEDIPKNGDM